MLEAGRDIHRLPEIILPLVRVDGETEPFVKSELEPQAVAFGLDLFPDAERRRDPLLGRREGGHHGVADRLDDGAASSAMMAPTTWKCLRTLS